MIEFRGTFNILFAGRTEYTQVTILNSVVDSYGHVLYLVGPDNVIYNWTNILIMRKVK